MAPRDTVVEDDARMTAKKVQALCKESGGYSTRCLNEKLYLHFKGWPKIENLEEFTGARVIWLEGNGLQKMEGLHALTGLRQIYLQQNCIKKIENLEGLDELCCINLSENFITAIENLSHLPKLETLQLNNNNIVSLENLQHLRECKTVRCVELSKNQIEDPGIVDVLASLPNLRLLKLDGNPVIRKIPQYRKTMITRLRNLTYLDDRPVFEEERLTAEAWARGGVEAEKMERQRQRAAKKAKEERRHKAFFEMVDRAKKDKKAEDKAEARRRREREVMARNENVAVIMESDAHEEAQEALVDKLATEVVSQKRHGEGKRRTKCVITEVAEDADATRKTTCNIVEVSELSEAEKEAAAASSKATTSRRAKSRKDREARLKAAMAAVEAERGDSGTGEVSGQKQEAPAPRFAQLSNDQIEAKLAADTEEVKQQDENHDEDAELITTGNKVNEASPILYNTSKYDEVWAKATEMESQLEDTEAVNVVADDMTALLDVEELD